MASRCRSTIGKRPANTTCDTFRSTPTDENGAIAKVEQSTPNLISCGPCTSGVTLSSRMRSRCDLSENRACLPPGANVTACLTGSRRASRFSFLPTDGGIGRPALVVAEDCWVLRFRLMVKRGPLLRPQASEGEAQHGPFCWIGRIGQADKHLHCG